MPVFDPMDHVTPPDDLDVLRELSDQAFEFHRQVKSPFQECSALEVGTWAGGSALVLAETFDKVYCVDHWRGNPADRLGEIAARLSREVPFQTFCRNMGDKLYRSIIPCYGTSWTYGKIWPSRLAMIFIDGDHRYKAVKRDIALWLPHVEMGGILCGHDYNLNFEGTVQAVNEAFAPTAFKFKSNVWWHVKR